MRNITYSFLGLWGGFPNKLWSQDFAEAPRASCHQFLRLRHKKVDFMVTELRLAEPLATSIIISEHTTIISQAPFYTIPLLYT